LTVSSGPAPISIPSVQGLSQDQAFNVLRQAGFTNPTGGGREPSGSIPAGQVTRTDPAAGQQVAPNTTIKIFVSSGAPTVTVPDERGKTFAAAQADLGAKGFSVSRLNVVNPANEGLVVDQSPSAGTSVAPGSNVVLTVGTAAPTTTTARAATHATTSSVP
jgi:serine/threonine-protein kinase